MSNAQPTTIVGHFSTALKGILSTITTTATAAEETVGIATGFVHNRAMEQKHTDKAFVQQRTARKLSELAAELQSDPTLQPIIDELDKSW